MIRRLTLALLAAPLMGAAPEVPETRDWSATLKADLTALHDDIVANHPGMVNALDPDFAKRNDTAFALAMKRAAVVRDYAGYRFALFAFAASFDDGHLALGAAGSAPPLDARWPGFLTGFDGKGAQVVMTRADDAPVPLGATLVECDGRKADALAKANVGAFEGRWFLASRRALWGGRLFVDRGNPFVQRPTRCTFSVDGKPRAIILGWQPIANDMLAKRIADTNQHAREPIGARILSDGTRWFTMSGFNGDPAGPDAKALVPMIAAMRADRSALSGAPRIVIDLRGNNGGSSDWSLQVAQVVWGEAAIAALPDISYVEWRPSLATIEATKKHQREFDESSDAPSRIKAYFARLVTGLSKANAAGQKLWRPPEPVADASKPAAVPVAPFKAPVYFITDNGCASACLDAVDLWRALGAIQVGQETSADTLYMDVRETILPSGLTGAVVPMKVFRGRPRGSNVPVAPDYRYAEDLRDTAALASWIATLPHHR